MSAIKWAIEGEYMEACSCHFLCPCVPSNATAASTYDFCKVALTFFIKNGQYDDVPLDGVSFALIHQSKAIMAEGEWFGGLVVDSSASQKQAEAVAVIAGGKSGGPWDNVAPMVSDDRGMERRSIKFEQEGARRSVKIEGLLDQSIEGVASATVLGECIVIDNAKHPANTRLNIAKAITNVISAFGIKWEGKPGEDNGHFAPFSWQGEVI